MEQILVLTIDRVCVIIITGANQNIRSCQNRCSSAFYKAASDKTGGVRYGVYN